MLRQQSVLVMLVKLMEQVPWLPEPAQRPRGRSPTDAARLIVKALVIMILRRLDTAYAWLTCLTHDDPVAQPVRPLVHAHGRFPTRRTWEWRRATLPPHLPGLLGGFGRPLVVVLPPWACHGRAAAVDSTPWNTRGAVGHKQQKATGVMPHTSLDTEAGGRSPGGTAGGMAGSGIWRCRSGRAGVPWPQNCPQPRLQTMPSRPAC